MCGTERKALNEDVGICMDAWKFFEWNKFSICLESEEKEEFNTLETYKCHRFESSKKGNNSPITSSKAPSSRKIEIPTKTHQTEGF